MEAAKHAWELLGAGGELFAGLDLGKLRDQSALAVIEREDRPGGQHRLLLRFLRAFEVGTPYSAVLSEVVEAVRALGVMRLAVDRSGPGEAVYEHLVVELGLAW